LVNLQVWRWRQHIPPKLGYRLQYTAQKSVLCEGYGTWFGCELGLAAEVWISRATFGGQGLLEVVSVVSLVCACIYSLRGPLSARGCLLLATAKPSSGSDFSGGRCFRSEPNTRLPPHSVRTPSFIPRFYVLGARVAQSVSDWWWLAYWLRHRRVGVRFPTEQKSVSSPQHTCLFWGLSSLLSCEYRVPFHGVKQPWREADHLPPLNDEIKKSWSYALPPPYVFMAWRLTLLSVRSFFLALQAAVYSAVEGF
jgi:hypothetical protein